MDAIAGVDDLAFALLATLAAFGISFTAVGGIDEVGPWVVDQFEQFVDSAGESLSAVRDQMRYGVNKAGDLIGNAYALSFNARFAQWLESEYDLVDNSSTSTAPPVQDSYTLGGYPCLPVPVTYGSGSRLSGVTSSTSPDPTFVFIFYNANNTGFFYIPFSQTSSSFTATLTFGQLTSSIACSLHSSNYYYYPSSFSSLNFNYYDSPPSDYILPYSLYSSVANGSFFVSAGDVVAPSVPDSDVVINTGVIDIPQVGDYSDDDGILIDGLGSWGDTLQDIWDKVSGLTVPDSTWPTVTWGAELADQLVDALVSAGELTTENSPGFYNGLPLIGGIPDIQFGNLWHYVTDWVGSMSGGLSLIGGIMFSLPFVAAFYALVVILLVLSLWRLLRSA